MSHTDKRSLHTVNRSPLQSSLLEDCLECAGEHDSLLLLEDAVLVARDTDINRELLSDTTVALFALENDARARGITENELLPGVVLVDYAGFVRLSCDHHRVVSWC